MSVAAGRPQSQDPWTVEALDTWSRVVAADLGGIQERESLLSWFQTSGGVDNLAASIAARSDALFAVWLVKNARTAPQGLGPHPVRILQRLFEAVGTRTHGEDRDVSPSQAEPDEQGGCHTRANGFDLHAGLVVPAGQRERLHLTHDGQVRLRLRQPWRDGTTDVVFDPVEFLGRLAALVPRPRINLMLYHGVEFLSEPLPLTLAG
jgi:Putative transposase